MTLNILVGNFGQMTLSRISQSLYPQSGTVFGALGYATCMKRIAMLLGHSRLSKWWILAFWGDFELLTFLPSPKTLFLPPENKR